MLELGLQGKFFSKTEHRNAVLPLLDHRTAGAVERKHQNISAILIEEKVPYISGYKPLGNYQLLLREVVLEELAARAVTRQLIEVEVKRVPEIPSFNDMLSVLTSPPAPTPGMDRPPKHARGSVKAPVDYLAMEAGNRALGLAGEKFALRWEQARLEAVGRSGLASQVCHVSVERGDGFGYDILSFEEDTRERLIEVKTTKFGEYTPFYVSENELNVSKETADRYYLYRLYSFGAKARMFTLAGALNEQFNLSPSAYVARPR